MTAAADTQAHDYVNSVGLHAIGGAATSKDGGVLAKRICYTNKEQLLAGVIGGLAR